MFLVLTHESSLSSVQRVGGIFGVITAFIAYYIGLSELLAAEEQAVISLPLGVFTRRV